MAYKTNPNTAPTQMVKLTPNPADKLLPLTMITPTERDMVQLNC